MENVMWIITDKICILFVSLKNKQSTNTEDAISQIEQSQ